MKAVRLSIWVLLIVVLISLAAWAQVRPPTITFINPHGGQRGTTVTFTVEGTNLGDASQVLFDDSGISGRIVSIMDLGPDVVERPPGSTAAPIEDRARRNQLAVEVTIGPGVKLGKHGFRINTSLGTTNLANIIVGSLPETKEVEPNDDVVSAQKVSLPTTINGALEEANDSDSYRFDARAGQQLVFEVAASALQSNLDSTLTLLDDKGNVLASNDDFNGRQDSVLAYTFTESGSYVIRVSDALNGGSKRHFYRLTIGELAYITSIFPLGVRKGRETEVSIQGYNLGGIEKVKVKAPEGGLWGETVEVSVKTSKGEPLNKVKVALGDHDEVAEQEPNDDLAHAQAINVPVTINGRIWKEAGGDQDLFRFKAKKGQRLIFSVAAQRLGSLLDSVIEILDAKGNEVPRATLRPVLQTSVTLRDHDSLGRGIRLDSWAGINLGDLLLIDSELIQVTELPKGPDEDTRFKDFRGRRLGLEDTTPQAHALNSPVYKVEIHKPGTEFPPNGMPLFHLTYRNDDGNPTLIYGKDSRLTFTAPEDGQYYVRIKDVRGQSGKLYAYRLTVAEPNPDFELFVSPANPNVPRGGRIPITVFAYRIDGFDGKIDVQIAGLPEGLQATNGTILAGESSVVLTISASENASLKDVTPLKVIGRAEINGKEVSREADPEEPISVISLAAPPDLYIVSVEPEQIQLEPGGKAQINVKIKRANGFGGRVPLTVRNLPYLLWVPDVGLNGILITEQEESRSFYIVADPGTEPFEQTLFITGKVETNSPLPTDHASVPIKLKVLPKRTVASR